MTDTRADTTAYFCKVCGYSPTNRASWCDLGCGRDYNEMIGVPQRHLDGLLADAAEQRAHMHTLIADAGRWCKAYSQERACVAALETALRVIAESDEWGMARRVARAALAAPAPCDGSSDCPATRHIHGCYSDDGTNCDHPGEHVAASAPADTNEMCGESSPRDGSTDTCQLPKGHHGAHVGIAYTWTPPMRAAPAEEQT